MKLVFFLNGFSRGTARQLDSVIPGSVSAVRKASRYLETLSGNFCQLTSYVWCESCSSISLLQPLGVFNFRTFRLLCYLAPGGSKYFPRRVVPPSNMAVRKYNLARYSGIKVYDRPPCVVSSLVTFYENNADSLDRNLVALSMATVLLNAQVSGVTGQGQEYTSICTTKGHRSTMPFIKPSCFHRFKGDMLKR